MAYEELDTGGNGLLQILNFPNVDTPLAWPMILFGIFMVITLATFFRQLRRETKADMLSSLAVAGFATSVLATPLSLLGLISTNILTLTLVICGVFVLLYIIKSNK